MLTQLSLLYNRIPYVTIYLLCGPLTSSHEYKSHSKQSGIKSTRTKIIMLSKAKLKPLLDHPTSLHPHEYNSPCTQVCWWDWAARVSNYGVSSLAHPPLPRVNTQFDMLPYQRQRLHSAEDAKTGRREGSQRHCSLQRGQEGSGTRLWAQLWAEASQAKSLEIPGAPLFSFPSPAKAVLSSSLTLPTYINPSASCPFQTWVTGKFQNKAWR